MPTGTRYFELAVTYLIGGDIAHRDERSDSTGRSLRTSELKMILW
jgi:hypothetical protein